MEGNAHSTTQPESSVKGNASRVEQIEWIFGESFNLLAVLYVVWIGLSLIIHGKRTGKWRRENQSNASQFACGKVYTSAVFAAFCSFLRLLANQVAFNVGYTDESSSICEVVVDICFACYTLTIISTYLFLWFRQRSLYQHPAMKFYRKTWLTGLSWISIIFTFSASSLISLSFIIPESSVQSRYGCARRSSDFIFWPYYLLIVFSTIAQGFMLFLLLYPLFSHVTTNNGERVMRIMQRSAVFAGVCVLSDVLVVVIVLFVVSDKATRVATLTAYDINMIVNISCVFFSFERWRTLLASPVTYCFSFKSDFEAPPTANTRLADQSPPTANTRLADQSAVPLCRRQEV